MNTKAMSDRKLTKYSSLPIPDLTLLTTLIENYFRKGSGQGDLLFKLVKQ